jgi:hypothetical protein
MTSMSIPYKLMKSKFCTTIIAKSWPMKFVMLEYITNHSLARICCLGELNSNFQIIGQNFYLLLNAILHLPSFGKCL